MSLKSQLKVLEKQHQERIKTQSQSSPIVSSDFKPWKEWARPDQLPPKGDWLYWILCCGRAFGKTLTGSQTTINYARHHPGARIALIGRTANDVNATMIHGISGIMACSPPDFTPIHNKSDKTLRWPNGTVAQTFSAEEPESLRGPQFNYGWLDELACWYKPEEAFTQFKLGLRLKNHGKVRCVITTTPRPIELIKALLDPNNRYYGGKTVVTTGTTLDNAANLDPDYLDTIISRYKGTTLGRQEVYAEILSDIEGALWKRAWIDNNRLLHAPDTKQRIVIGVDPSGGSGKENDAVGIVVASSDHHSSGYVLCDASGKMTHEEWSYKVIELYDAYKADCIVVEKNFGGDMVTSTIRSIRPNLPLREIHSSKGKDIRAEPVSMLYQQNKVHHIGTNFLELESELTQWTPLGDQDSPNRLDALVFALTDLMLKPMPIIGTVAQAKQDKRAIFGGGTKRRF